MDSHEVLGSSGDDTFDVVVVGNGVLGLSLALELTRRNVKTALVGQPQRPWAASAAAGAMLGCFGEATSALLASEPGRAKLSLDVQARDRWSAWLDALDEDTTPEERESGSIRCANGTVVILNTVGSDAIDNAHYAAIRQAAEMYDEPVETLDANSLDWMDPVPAARPMHAMFLPSEHAVDSGLLLQRLEQAFLRRGGTLVSDLAVVVETQDDCANGVLLDSGARLSSRQVVIAAGARSHDLLPPAVAENIPPMVAGVGVSAVLRTPDATVPDSVIRTPNRAFACGLHLVPRDGGNIYVGATNCIHDEVLDLPSILDTSFLLSCATSQIRRDLEFASIVRLQAGNRPVALDGFPLIGPTGVTGLWMMTGTYRDGLHMSPLLAAEMATMVLGGDCTIAEFDAFHPVRLPLQVATRAEIIEATALNSIAMGYETPWNISYEWDAFLNTSQRRFFEQVANDIDPVFTPPPEILASAARMPGLVKMLQTFYGRVRTKTDQGVA